MKPIVMINLKESIKFFLKLIFFLFLNYSFAQNIIKAEIIDEKTSKSVSYASVEFLGTFKGIIADYNGQFSLPLSKIKGITKIKISSIGYEKLEINLDSLSTTKFNLKEFLEVLPRGKSGKFENLRFS